MTRWWRSHTVRVRLTLWYVATMIVVLAVYAAAVFGFVEQRASQALNQQLRRDFQWISAAIYYTPEGTLTSNAPEEIAPEEGLPWVQVWDASGRRLLFRNAEAQRIPIPDSQLLAVRADGQIATVGADDIPIRVLSRRGGICRSLERTVANGLCVSSDDDQPPVSPVPVVIQVARSEAPLREELGELLWMLLLGLPLAVSLAGIGAYTLARRALRPIERMAERARTITAENLSDRLPVHNPDDEMGRLATVFNETLARLEASFEQMRRFTADVSHELRTPLTSIRSVGEVGLREHRDDAQYRTIIGSMLEEVDRLASLVDRLLTLSRAETGDAQLTLEEVSLRALASDVVAHLGVLAEEKSQSIAVEENGDPVARADRLGLRQALINLVDNAIKFSPRGARVRIRLSEAGADAVVDVIDTGGGIEAGARERIFDRFYRAANGGADARGAGLGLSIARGAVEAMGGRLTLQSSGPGGTTFRIVVPRADPAGQLAHVGVARPLQQARGDR
jgi:heavy metal sensor kinase